jgi:hypothetical protein
MHNKCHNSESNRWMMGIGISGPCDECSPAVCPPMSNVRPLGRRSLCTSRRPDVAGRPCMREFCAAKTKPTALYDEATVPAVRWPACPSVSAGPPPRAHRPDRAVSRRRCVSRCPRSAGRDVAPRMFSTDRSVAENHGSAGLDEGIGMGQPRNGAALSLRPPSSRHSHRTAGGLKTMMRLTDLVLGLR